jgi:hypothetical protein
VRPFGVAGLGERVKQLLQLADRGWLTRLGAEPFLGGLLEPFGFALGLRVAGVPVFLDDPKAAEPGFQAVAAAFAAGECGHPGTASACVLRWRG